MSENSNDNATQFVIKRDDGHIRYITSITLPATPTEWGVFLKEARRAAVNGRTTLSPDLALVFKRGSTTAEWAGEKRMMIYEEPIDAVVEYLDTTYDQVVLPETEGAEQDGTDGPKIESPDTAETVDTTEATATFVAE